MIHRGGKGKRREFTPKNPLSAPVTHFVNIIFPNFAAQKTITPLYHVKKSRNSGVACQGKDH